MSGEQIILRPWQAADVEALSRYADNRKIWINLRDRFPYHYTRSEAEKWIAICAAHQGPPTNFAIERAGEAIGGVGCELMGDVHCKTAEVGYWLGEPFWGRGIATTAVKRMTDFAFSTFALERLQALVFEWNPASARVLEKAGYTLEGRLRRNIFKDGRLADSMLYARIRSD
jgi:ribosomal-protein-alanine N-acetyltransferase